MKVGKLSNEELQEVILNKLHKVREDVLIGPGIGLDCAVVDFGESSLVISSDPITGASNNIGSIAVGINCNDIAASGGEAVGIMFTILAPPGTAIEELGKIMEDASETAANMGIEILGGHTEITDAVNRIVVSATAVGKIATAKVRSPEKVGYEGGEALLMTKWAGLEGSGIIAGDFADDLKEVLSPEESEEAVGMLKYISVEKDGRIAADNGALAMHDVTEGGILGAIWEICTSQNMGCEIELANIPVKEVTRKICSHFNIDPLKLISSGSLLIVCKSEKCDKIIETMSEESIDCVKIGELKKHSGITMLNGDNSFEIQPPGSDELYKVVTN